MTLQPSTGSLIFDYRLDFSSTPLTAADIASFLACGLSEVNTFQNFAMRGFLPREQGEFFPKQPENITSVLSSISPAPPNRHRWLAHESIERRNLRHRLRGVT